MRRNDRSSAVAVGKLAAGTGAVALQFTVGIDHIRAEGQGSSVGTYLLVPADGSLVAIQNVAQMTVGHPAGIVTSQNSLVDLGILAVQVIGIDELVGSNAATQAVGTILSVHLTRVPAVDDLTVVGEPTGEDSTLTLGTDVTSIVAILDDHLEATATVVATYEGSGIGAGTYDVAFHTDVLNGQRAVAVAATSQGCRAVTAVDDAALVKNQVLDGSCRYHAEETELLGCTLDAHVLDAVSLTVERAPVATGVTTDGGVLLTTQVNVGRQNGG